MRAKLGLELGPDIRVQRIDRVPEGVMVAAAAVACSGECPDCGVKSTSRKGGYVRRLQDLPVQGAPVRLEIGVTRWRCRNRLCARQSFTGSIATTAPAHARRTSRVSDLARLGLRQSDDTILRALKRHAAERRRQPLRVAGIDDWSWRKGRSYGTIVVDLERREVVDVLADRSAKTTARWLAQRPEVEIITRDRSGVYAQGARTGAPRARQVADRFHLLENLRERIEQQLSRAHPAANAAEAPVSRAAGHGAQPELAQHLLLAQRGRRAIRLDRFARVKALQREGKRLRQIVIETGLHWRTVAKWARLDALPPRRKMAPRSTAPIKFERHLAQRWAEGIRTARRLLPEIRELGYTGSHSHLERLLAQWRQALRGPTPEELDANDAGMGRHLPPSTASFLCMKPRGQLTEREAQSVAKLTGDTPGFALMRKLAMRFRGILKGRNRRKLDVWLKDAHGSGLYALRRFVRTIRQDIDAVRNAISLHWSNGQTEGQINRLKALQRSMYGRAGAELLRARLIPLSEVGQPKL